MKFVFAFFVIVAIMFWSPILFFGYFPWMGDIVTQYYPWYVALYRHIHTLQLPFWIPEMGAGYPLFAQGEAGVFYPLYWVLIALFSAPLGFKIAFVVHSIIASIGGYYFARRIGIRMQGALFAGLVFAYSFFFTARSIHFSILAAGSFLPWGFWAVEKIVSDKRKTAWVSLSIIVALQWLAGHPQIAFISISSYIAYFVFRIWKSDKRLRRSVLLILGLFFGCGIALVQIVPTIVLAMHSSRLSSDSSFIFSYSLPKSQFITYLFPYFFGISTQNNNVGFWQFGGHFWEFALYIGILPLVLAIVAVLFLMKKKLYAKLLAVLWLFFGLCAVGGYFPPYRWIVNLFHLPFRVSARFLLPTTLVAATLAGFGFDYVLVIQNKGEKLIKAVLCIETIAVILLVIGTLVDIFSIVPIVVAGDTWFRTIAAKILFTEFQKVSLSNFSVRQFPILFFLLLISISGSIIVLYQKQKVSRFFYTTVLFGLFFVDSFFLGFLYQHRENERNILKPPSFTHYFNTNMETRMMTLTEPLPIQVEKYTMQPNSNLLWNVSSLNSTTPLQLQFHEQFYAYVRRNLNKLSMFGVSHVISAKPLDDPNFILIDRNEFSYVYKNTAVYPKAYMVYAYQTADISTYLSLLDYGFNPKEKVVLQENPAFVLKDDGSAPYQVNQLLYTKQKTAYIVHTARDGILVTLDSFYPEWQVSVDGIKTKLYQADGIFRAVYVPKGDHTVAFEYVPQSFYVGLVGSSIAGVVLIVLGKKMRKDTYI